MKLVTFMKMQVYAPSESETVLTSLDFLAFESTIGIFEKSFYLKNKKRKFRILWKYMF